MLFNYNKREIDVKNPELTKEQNNEIQMLAKSLAVSTTLDHDKYYRAALSNLYDVCQIISLPIPPNYQNGLLKTETMIHMEMQMVFWKKEMNKK